MSGLERLWAGWRSEYIASATDDEREKGAAGAADGERCVFCRILASGEDDAVTHVVWRHPAGTAVAILNAYPYASGHLMVMPVRHVADLETLGEEEAAALWSGVRAGVGALKSAYRPDGINIGANLGRAAGAGVPGHLHVHAVPRWTGDSSFMTSIADTRVLPEALSVSARKVRDAWG